MTAADVMKARRRATGGDYPTPKEKGPNGRGLCRWCKSEVPAGRFTWCSDACVAEYRIRSDPGFARERVEQRDDGQCALCGTETLAWEHAYQAEIERLAQETQRVHQRFRALRLPDHTWADHVVPVVEGGGACGLDNLRTLCIPCHHRETAALAARRARKNRKQIELPEIGCDDGEGQA